MKLNGKILVAMVMVVGAMATTGCNKAATDNAIAPEDNPATAPVDDGTPGFEQNSLKLSFFADAEPPAARREEPGRAPSDRHFWVGGYWRWNGRQHVWVNGRWEQRRDRYDYRSPRWERRGARWQYVPGHWVRR